MTAKSRCYLALYFLTGAVIYGVIQLLAGGLGLLGIQGPAGLLLEFLLTVVAWPLIVILSILVVIQGR
mgnify:CR=1 FL=1